MSKASIGPIDFDVNISKMSPLSPAPNGKSSHHRNHSTIIYSRDSMAVSWLIVRHLELQT